MFEIVEVETINFCNNDCSFCPANYLYDKRKHLFMSRYLIDKIATELSDLNYSGQVNLFSQGEPLLDPRMSDIISLFRKLLPQATLTLYTNCLLLTPHIFKSIILNLDHIVLNLYQPSPKQVEKTVDECIEYAKNLNLINRIELRQQSKKEILTTKGGLAPNKKLPTFQPDSCILPFRQLVIKSTGNVVLCCNDVYEKHIIGNLNDNSLINIWNSDDFIQLRKRILMGRKNIDICSLCDVNWEKQKGLHHLSPLTNEETNHCIRDSFWQEQPI